MIDEKELNISESQKKYWKKNVAIIRNLLIIWGVFSLGASILFANFLHEIKFFGVTLSFWFAHQGTMVIFVCLIFYYAWRMDRLDKEYNVFEYKKGGKSK